MKTISYVEMSKPFYQFPYHQKNHKLFLSCFVRKLFKVKLKNIEMKNRRT